MEIPESIKSLLPFIFILVLYLSRKQNTNKMVSQQTVEYVQKLIKENKVIIFAKSYCPYCKAAKHTIFEEINVPKSKALVLDLDLMDNGQEIQQALLAINGQKTVPHVYINGEFIGGNSEVQKIYKSGELQKMVEAL
ncbi:dithiol glutaredoxin GRX2 NDAI_0F04430 [Naumovozyma dairenensis CBS 421]|uniref:Glutaredoxin domain-containing protein n=1 Tax=Naumovozyma dairenensis (strain ATCC 10597 / BCRC 20456 / CBS 421 / NBRC 0211 / NRRL Y-12639) TaxID=1071378 RepID=G0WDA0_NAUDC|nr:hypothetical protein NDAI_0F04430 [Naumovozyma dairenensis CBS 421]CCD25761.1 hypothetical protein NDAI_0F04430 [Naumovozyma dairenensis CBS 421]